MAATNTASPVEQRGRMDRAKSGLAEARNLGNTMADAFVNKHSSDHSGSDSRLNQISSSVQVIGGAVITIAIIVIVVNEVLTTSAVNNSSGPFSGVIDSLETTGVAAMGLLVVALLVAAAGVIMRYMGGNGGGGF